MSVEDEFKKNSPSGVGSQALARKMVKADREKQKDSERQKKLRNIKQSLKKLRLMRLNTEIL